MRHIHFSDVGIAPKSIEELDEIYLTYTALGIPIEDTYKENYEEAQAYNLKGWHVQCTIGDIRTKLDGSELVISLIQYPITYSMESLDYAVACHLLNSNQTEELIAHLDKHCKEYK